MMYYILGNDYRYYAGKCSSDKRTPVWKSCKTRALSFNTIEDAISKAKQDNVFYLGIDYVP